MCQIIVIILIASFAQAHATDSTGRVIDKSVDVLFDRALKVAQLRDADLDATTFAKTCAQTRPTLYDSPRLAVHRSSSPVSRSLFPLAPSLAPILHNSLQIPRSLTISQASQKRNLFKTFVGNARLGNRKDKIARRKKRSIMTKVVMTDIEQQMDDVLCHLPLKAPAAVPPSNTVGIVW